MRTANTTTAALSFSFDVIVIGLLICFGKLRSSNQTRLLLLLFVSDALEMLNMFMWGEAVVESSTEFSENICRAQGALSQIFMCTAILCTTCVAVEIHIGVLRPLHRHLSSASQIDGEPKGETEEELSDVHPITGRMYLAVIVGCTTLALVLPFIPSSEHTLLLRLLCLRLWQH